MGGDKAHRQQLRTESSVQKGFSIIQSTPNGDIYERREKLSSLRACLLGPPEAFPSSLLVRQKVPGNISPLFHRWRIRPACLGRQP